MDLELIPSITDRFSGVQAGGDLVFQPPAEVKQPPSGVNLVTGYQATVFDNIYLQPRPGGGGRVQVEGVPLNAQELLPPTSRPVNHLSLEGMLPNRELLERIAGKQENKRQASTRAELKDALTISLRQVGNLADRQLLLSLSGCPKIKDITGESILKQNQAAANAYRLNNPDFSLFSSFHTTHKQIPKKQSHKLTKLMFNSGPGFPPTAVGDVKKPNPLTKQA